MESQDGEIYEYYSDELLRPYLRWLHIKKVEKEEETIGRSESDSEIESWQEEECWDITNPTKKDEVEEKPGRNKDCKEKEEESREVPILSEYKPSW